MSRKTKLVFIITFFIITKGLSNANHYTFPIIKGTKDTLHILKEIHKNEYQKDTMMLIVNLNKALNEGMKNKNIFIQLIKIYVKKGLFENGLEVCESGLNRNPQDSILLKLKIEILLREKTLSTLIKEYELKAKEDKSLNNLKVLSMLYLNADDSHWFEKLSNLIESQGIVDFETYYQIGGGYYQRASNIKKIVDRMDNEMYLSKGGIYEKELEMLFLKSLKYLESAYVIRQDTGLKEIINQLYVQLKVSPLKRKF